MAGQILEPGFAFLQRLRGGGPDIHLVAKPVRQGGEGRLFFPQALESGGHLPGQPLGGGTLPPRKGVEGLPDSLEVPVNVPKQRNFRQFPLQGRNFVPLENFFDMFQRPIFPFFHIFYYFLY